MTNFEIARQFTGLNAVELAELLKVSPQHLNAWLKELRTPNRNNVAGIAEKMDVDPAWLLGVPQTLPVVDPLTGKQYLCGILRSEAIDGYGMLYHVYMDETGTIVPVIVSGGTQLTTTDWETADIPRRAGEIKDFAWMGPGGQGAVMLDGLPRIIG